MTVSISPSRGHPRMTAPGGGWMAGWDEGRADRHRHRRQGVGLPRHPARDQLRHARRDRELRAQDRTDGSMRENRGSDNLHQQGKEGI